MHNCDHRKSEGERGKCRSLTRKDLLCAAGKEQWSVNWWEQFRVLLSRSLKERRHEVFNHLRIAQVFTVAIFAGLLWWQTPPSHIQDRVSTDPFPHIKISYRNQVQNKMKKERKFFFVRLLRYVYWALLAFLLIHRQSIFRRLLSSSSSPFFGGSSRCTIASSPFHKNDQC